MWRYRDSLPAPDGVEPVSLGEGGSPLVPLRGEPDGVYAKVEYESPTGAFKDRGTAVVVTRFRHIGLRHVIEDSSGNAGASMAAYCAVAGIRCTVYVPAGVSAAKLTQMRTYGADVVPVPGDRTAVGEAAIAAAEHAYYASHAWDPYYAEGTKTAAFEIAEQLPEAPARVVLPVGQGTMLLGLAKGFRELFASGRIQRLPALSPCRATRARPSTRRSTETWTTCPWCGRGRHPRRGDRDRGPAALEGAPRGGPRERRHHPPRRGTRRSPGRSRTSGATDCSSSPPRRSRTRASPSCAARKGPLDGATVLIVTGSGLKASAIIRGLMGGSMM